MSLLGERVLAVHRALDAASIPHAIGGAIALGYCTADPRGTSDIDCNVFVEPEQAQAVFDALPSEVRSSPEDVRLAERDGQIRLWWDTTPVDLFFCYHPFHVGAGERARRVPFEGTDLPVLDCTDLAVFKCFFNRTKDWADIEAMVAVGAVDVAALRRWLIELLGTDDPRLARLAQAVSAAVEGGGPARFDPA